MVYYQALKATESAGSTGYDAGLRSTTENPKTLLSVLLQVKEEPEHDSMLQIWYEKEKIAEVPLRLFDSPKAVGAESYAYNRLNELEIGFKIPIGALVKLAVKCVGATQTVIGAYRYEITG